MQLPPEKILQHIRLSALSESSRSQRMSATMSWREWRYKELLKGKAGEADGAGPLRILGSAESSWLPRIRNMLFDKINLSSYSGGLETSSYKRSVSYEPPEGSSFDDHDDVEHKEDCSIEMGTIDHPEDSTTGIWGWVKKHDELTSAMESGAVLYGFVEAPITFPPSFKWKKDCHAGDFTDLGLLAGKGFSSILPELNQVKQRHKRTLYRVTKTNYIYLYPESQTLFHLQIHILQPRTIKTGKRRCGPLHTRIVFCVTPNRTAGHC